MLGRRGQIVIPALFVLPSLMLFLYLIFETAKLSREKIRMQFSLDTAAFIDVSNYADLLNRTAYVNGAFPARVFLDAFGGDMVEMRNQTADVPLLGILFDRGMFPTPGGKYPPDIPASSLDRDLDVWPIRYAEGTSQEAEGKRAPMNTIGGDDLGSMNVIGGRQVRETWIAYERAVSIWQLVSQIFSLLGSVYEAQVKVNNRLMGDHSFYKKSWMLNSGLDEASAQSGLQALRAQANLKVQCHYVSQGGTYGFTIKQGPLGPYYTGFGFGDDQHPDAAPSGGGPPCPYGSGQCAAANSECPGLFQYATANAGLNELAAGYRIKQTWPTPPNYFKVDVNRLGNGGQKPYVHVVIAVKGNGPGGVKNTWPDPTPRYQTREYP